MQNLKYLFQFLLTILFFFLFKIIGLSISSYLSGKIFEVIGPIFRSKKIINSNIKKAFPLINSNELKRINSAMWNNYGRVFAEYMFIKNFRKNYFDSHVIVNGKKTLKEIKNSKKPVIFISGHFGNFELMAMALEKSGINLSAIYRPLNNYYLNIIMERIRTNYICKHQIKKGVSGLREIVKLNKKGYSTALMIDQRVSQGIKSNFFNQKAYTTTIPAQLYKKYGFEIVPVFLKRIKNINFEISISEPIKFSKNTSVEDITLKLNRILEKMILSNPEQWIWTHNRWK